MKKRILLVEDNPATIDVIQKELEFLGYESAVAQDGKEGIEKAVSYLPDLIIMDISLPKMDGLEASTLIRKNPKTQSIPILAATARATSTRHSMRVSRVERRTSAVRGASRSAWANRAPGCRLRRKGDLP